MSWPTGASIFSPVDWETHTCLKAWQELVHEPALGILPCRVASRGEGGETQVSRCHRPLPTLLQAGLKRAPRGSLCLQERPHPEGATTLPPPPSSAGTLPAPRDQSLFNFTSIQAPLAPTSLLQLSKDLGELFFSWVGLRAAGGTPRGTRAPKQARQQQFYIAAPIEEPPRPCQGSSHAALWLSSWVTRS